MVEEEIVYDMERKLQRPRATHGDLQDLIGNMNEKLSDVTNHLEQEFLSAYRVHQISIQEELKELKERVAKAEESLVEDGAVARMEEECNWFKGESKRLQGHVSAMTKDMNTLKARLQDLRDQKGYLSEQLKAILKRSRVFRAEIDYVQQQGIASIAEDATGSQAFEKRSTSTPVRSKSTAALPSPTAGAKAKKSKKASAARRSASADDILHEMEHKLRQTQHIEEKYKMKVEDMTNLQSESDFLLAEALNKQFEKVVERKTTSVLRGLRNRQDLKNYSENGGTPGVVPSQFMHEIPKLNGLTGVGVEHMTEMDKFQAMVIFLSDAGVFRDNVEGIQASFS
jgi:hypothetical protein